LDGRRRRPSQAAVTLKLGVGTNAREQIE
jgi:hypothetical protein